MISVVLAVYNSAAIVGETIARIVATCEAQGWRYEIIAVDDGSRDGSLAVLRQSAARHGQLRVIALERNGGQHAALLAGLRAAAGDPVVCLDDDLQHPPEAIPLLVHATGRHDAVFARFDERRHPSHEDRGFKLTCLQFAHGRLHPRAITPALESGIVDRTE